MNLAETFVRLVLLMPVSFVSAAAVSYFVPRANAAEVEAGVEPMKAEVGVKTLKIWSDEYNERVVQSQWEKQRRWTLVYKGRRDALYKARIGKLTLISLGAVVQVAATQVPLKWITTTSFVGGLLVAAGGVVKKQFICPEQVEQMCTSFYIAQTLKSEIVKYRTKTSPYNGHKKEALTALRENCNKISGQGSDRRFYMMSRDAKPVPTDMSTKEAYISKRVEPRINKFLIGKGKDMEKKGKLCSNIEDGLIAFGTFVGVSQTQSFPPFIKNFLKHMVGWTGAFTTISAGFANHHAKMQYEEIADKYFDAAAELREMIEIWPMDVNSYKDDGWDDQIAKFEEIIISTTEEFAKKRTGNQDLSFNKAPTGATTRAQFADKVWNDNVVCGDDESGDFPAIERANWLVNNVEGMTLPVAKQQVMAEFPLNFQR